MMRSVRVIIEGRVQGVFFRAWTTAEAQRRAIRGWVRNRRDGTVEALFIGATNMVDEMLAACRCGPSASKVSAVRAFEMEDDGSVGFRHRSTV